MLDSKLRDIDDTDGHVGEHFLVKCVIAVPDTNVPVSNMLGREERTCLVDAAEFYKWLNAENSIKWI